MVKLKDLYAIIRVENNMQVSFSKATQEKQ